MGRFEIQHHFDGNEISILNSYISRAAFMSALSASASILRLLDFSRDVKVKGDVLTSSSNHV
jgi:hypothetical protein